MIAFFLSFCRCELVQVSQYALHLQRYLKFFDRNQIHIVDGDTLVLNPYLELKKVTVLAVFMNINIKIIYINK